MARTDSQRALPLWLFIAAAVLLAARIALTLLAPAPVEQPKGEGDLVQWVPLERASMSTKPVLYDFTAAWCGPCRRLEAEVYADPELAAQINARFTPVKVVDRRREDGANTAQVDALQTRFEVRAFPTVVIVDGRGGPPAKMEGFGGPAAFAQLLDSVR
ncbi:MAG TPA: thioredoxin family protein [Thermoanaerobaculia bacterium]|nr:thioredoxin family protein [Thermoanaerobaculia bacterium]